MLQAPKFLLHLGSMILFLLIVFVILPGCTSDVITEEIQFKVHETNVWCDYMPGSLPRTHAVMNCELINTTRQPLVLPRAEGLIIDARSTSQLRRFICTILVDDTEVSQLTLPPQAATKVVFRTPMKLVVPFDIKIYNHVRFVVRCETNIDKNFIVTSPIVKPFKTQ